MSAVMVDAKPTLYPHWRQALKTLLEDGLTYGSTVSKTRIAKLCHLAQPKTAEDQKRYDLDMLNCTGEIKWELLYGHKMLLVSDNRGGYHVVLPTDQTQVAVERGTSTITKELKKIGARLAYTNVALLDDDGRRRNSDAQAKVATLAAMHRGGRRRLLGLTEK